MIRIKVPMGLLSFGQFRAILDVCDEYSTGKYHLTTRQDIQIHHVKLEDSPPEQLDLMGEAYSLLNQLFAAKLETLINANAELERSGAALQVDQEKAKSAERYKIGQAAVMQRVLKHIDQRLDELENLLGLEETMMVEEDESSDAE